jgi:DNA-binding beta-propeller fold protein YncE
MIALCACSQRVNEPFDGAAFPNRRPVVRWPTDAVAAVSTDNGSDTITVVSMADFSRVGTYPIGLDPIANDGPHHLALDPGRRVLFTAYAYPPPEISVGPHGNHGISTQLGIVVAHSMDDLRVVARADVESNPGDIVLTPDKSKVIVTHFELNRIVSWDGGLPSAGSGDPRASAVTIHDARTLQRLATLRPCLAAHGAAVTPDNRWLLVACYGEDAVSVTDLMSPSFTTHTFAVGPGAATIPNHRYGPYSLLLTPDATVGYTADLEGRDVREFTIGADGTLSFRNTRAVRVNAAAFFMDFGPTRETLLVPTQNPDQLVLVERSTMTIRRTRAFTASECRLPHQIARAPDGRYVLVCEGVHTATRTEPGALLIIDPETLETRARVDVGIYPDAVAFVQPQ